MDDDYYYYKNELILINYINYGRNYNERKFIRCT